MKQRQDIQALRGLAVLLVVFYHAKLFSIKSGYLGVDIFFVISGFLITHQIAQKALSHSFSLKEFYIRRIWRLLPAAYTVFFITSALAPFALIDAELQNYAKQLLGALSFTANFVLYNQSGYFSSASELKLLLHTWSLSIEEQYYIAIPLILALLSRKYWFALTAAISTLSLIIFFSVNPNASFYFTLSRCWELGAGTLLALLFIKTKQRPPSWLAYPALALLLFIVLTPSYLVSKKIDLVLLISFTTVIIACNARHLNSGILISLIAKLGTISYSLYLVHWPIIALINNLNVSNHALPLWARMASVITSLVAATLLHAQIEERFRNHYKKSNNGLKSIIFASLALVSISVLFSIVKPQTDYSFQMRHNNGLSINCSNKHFFDLKECSNSSEPEMLVWGDSFAMHLIPGLTSSNKGLMQASKTSCLPIRDISYFNPPSFDLSWGEDCIEFNHSVLNYLKTNSTIKTVVMASPWRHLLNLNTQTFYTNNGYRLITLNKHQIADEILDTAMQIRSLGIKVVIVAPPPKVGFDIGRCHEKISRRQIKIGGSSDCSLSYNEYQRFDQKVIALKKYLKTKGETMYSFEENLCDSRRCETILDNIVLYRDTGHFSYAGSEHYGRKFNLYDTLTAMAK